MSMYTPIAIAIAMKMLISIFEPGKSLSSPRRGVMTPFEDVGRMKRVLVSAILMNCSPVTLNTQLTMFAAIQFDIMQTITSLTPKKALKSPGSAPHNIPPAIPARSARSHTQNADVSVVGIARATSREHIAPMRYCPGAPMLKSPVFCATATDKPVSNIGVDSRSISPKLKRMFEALPLANGPPRIIANPVMASEKGISGENAARIIRISSHKSMPHAMHISEESIERKDSPLFDSNLPVFLFSFGVILFVICCLPPFPYYVLHRTYKDRVPERWYSSGQALRQFRLHTLQECDRRHS